MTPAFEDILVICADDGNWPRTLAYAATLGPPDRVRLTALTRSADLPVHGGMNIRDQVVYCRAGLRDAVSVHAAWSDVIVIDAPAAAEDLESVVVEGGRPCVVLPRDASLHGPRQIAVGWNGSVESMRALKAALPLLRAAEHVLLLDADAHPHACCSEPPSAATFLVEHGVVAGRLRSDGAAATAGRRIVELALAHGADLLVLGAWRHRRFSDWDTGATVSQALHEGALPVLLAH